MNAVEHIVESYFRYCKGCLTMADVKIPGGNNRQCDLLACNLATGEQYHVESSVTHQQNWCPSTDGLRDNFDRKYRGIQPKRDGSNTDSTRGKSYFEHITGTYVKYGLNPLTIRRVFVTWRVAENDKVAAFLADYERQYNIRVEVLSLRDDILDALRNEISTSNYDDEVLRTLSLLKQRNVQTRSMGKTASPFGAGHDGDAVEQACAAGFALPRQASG